MQVTMEKHPGVDTRPANVTGNVAGVIRDVVELGELQIRLLVRDTKSVVRQSVIPVILMVAAASMLLGAIPIALLGLAEALEVSAGLSRLVSLLIAAGVGAILAVILYYLGRWQLRKSIQQLDSSREELAQNAAWLKQVIASGGTSAQA
jgi:hypothetical protein